MIRLLILEPTSRWTAVLERAFATDADRQCRWQPFFPDFLAELRTGNADIAVVVTDANDNGIAVLTDIQQAAPPDVRIVCLVAGDDPQWEWAARELGADVVLTDVCEQRHVSGALDRLIRTACLPTSRRASPA
jgi:DNA-binding response OmpR family regulator